MKFLRILFLINTLVVFTFFVLLFTSETHSEITSEFTTEIPRPAAFKLLLTNLITASETKPETNRNMVQFIFFPKKRPVVTFYQIRPDQKRFTISLEPLRASEGPNFLKTLHHQIAFKQLVDGTTSIQWKTNYQVPSWTGKLINRFYWKPEIERVLNVKIKMLKQAFSS